MGFRAQERAVDPNSGRPMQSNPNEDMARIQKRKEFEAKLQATRSKFINVPNAQFTGKLMELGEEEDKSKMTLERFREVTPAMAQYQASGQLSGQQIRDQDDARARFYQEQNNVGMKNAPAAPLSGQQSGAMEQKIQNLHENTSDIDPTKSIEVPMDGSMSERLALLARKEKAFSSRLLDLKAQEEKFKAREAEITSSYIPKQKLVDDPFAVLKDSGLSYEQLTEKLLAQQQGVDPLILDMQSQIKRLEEQLSEQRNSVETKEKQSYEQAVQVKRNEVTSLINSDPQFELIKATNSAEDVVQMIVDTFKKDNVLLSPMEAALKIENERTEEIFKLASLSKIKTRLGMPKEVLSPQQEVIPSQSKTLSNEMHTGSQLAQTRKPRNWNEFKTQTLNQIKNRQLA